jgi:hypothetical protein
MLEGGAKPRPPNRDNGANSNLEQNMPDHEIMVLIQIQRLLNGTEWNADTLDAIATLLNENGYPVRDLDECLEPRT